jgi:Ca2+-binding EF-hand superfamily protein
MDMLSLFTTALATASLSTTLVLPPELEARFDRIDANHDGFISRHEAWADARLEERFSLEERDHNGRIDRAEFRSVALSR